MCTPVLTLFIHLCTFCSLGGWEQSTIGWPSVIPDMRNAECKSIQLSSQWLVNLSFKYYVFIYTLYVVECDPWALVPITIIYNFQQRISWLSHRWRTQRNAISNVNCRIQWIIESLNAPCAPWYSEEHACLSVIKFSTFPAFVSCDKAWILGACGPVEGRLSWNALAEPFAVPSLVW